MSLPTVAWFKTGDIPPGSEVDIAVEISKRITEDFGVVIGDTWSQIRQPGNPTLAGFGNLETTFQYQLHEGRRRTSWPCLLGVDRSNGAAPATPAPA